MSDVLIVGAKGQLGKALKRLDTGKRETVYAGIEEVDLTDPEATAGFIEEQSPAWIINCAAYTAVDKAESEQDLAFAINRDAVANIADAAGDARVIHISTDFVFSGDAKRPYGPEDEPEPINVYGESKLAGEQVLRQTLPDSSMIIRTAWLYALDGNNFVKTMLRLMQEREALTIVNDQRGTPTYALGLAKVIWRIVQTGRFEPGIFHWADEGITSWHGFACAIQDGAFNHGLLEGRISLVGLPTSRYPQAAKRPEFSSLDSTKLQKLTGIKGTPWHVHLLEMLATLRAEQRQ
ncbi:MAG: dTDP-4-dehydrorhamnose reductase [Pseudomonadales bacterium]|nr:dTDP-4-dehydrorhamnose reductase [Pseudomonadales bacterium]